MKTVVYYNEIDPFAAAWLRELIKAGHIAPGEVDERSIEDVVPSDLTGFTQCHFFAGIGVWSFALRRAGWPDSRPVWTGSCPCQPFSAAGNGAGENDPRHLWPVWFELIRSVRPPVIFGEQVSSKLVLGDGKANVRELWERKAALRLCKNWLERNPPQHLQGVQECRSKGVACEQTGFNIVQGEPIGSRSEGQGAVKGASLQPYGGMCPRGIGYGSLRGERDSFRHERTARMEYAVAGQDHTGERLHCGQHKGCALCHQCGLRRLGRGQNTQNSVHHPSKKERCITEAIERISGEIERANGYSWLNSLQADLEGTGYTCGAVDTCAAGVGAPHIRQRLYWVAQRLAYSERQRERRVLGNRVSAEGAAQSGRAKNAGIVEVRDGGATCGLADSLPAGRPEGRAESGNGPSAGGSEFGGMGDSIRAGLEGYAGHGGGTGGWQEPTGPTSPAGEPCRVDNAFSHGRFQGRHHDGEHDGEQPCATLHAGGMEHTGGQQRERGENTSTPGNEHDGESPGPTNGFWRDADWLFCRDGKWRTAQPGTFPLASRTPARVGRLRGYGNSIVAPQAEEFIRAYIIYEKEDNKYDT